MKFEAVTSHTVLLKKFIKSDVSVEINTGNCRHGSYSLIRPSRIYDEFDVEWAKLYFYGLWGPIVIQTTVSVHYLSLRAVP